MSTVIFVRQREILTCETKRDSGSLYTYFIRNLQSSKMASCSRFDTPGSSPLLILLGGQVFKLHCEEGWFNRRTHQLTKFQLRRQAQSVEFVEVIKVIKVQVLTCLDFAHLGRWMRAKSGQRLFIVVPGNGNTLEAKSPSHDMSRHVSMCLESLILHCGTKEHALHLYNKDLPVVLLHVPQLALESFAERRGKPTEGLKDTVD